MGLSGKKGFRWLSSISWNLHLVELSCFTFLVLKVLKWHVEITLGVSNDPFVFTLTQEKRKNIA